MIKIIIIVLLITISIVMIGGTYQVYGDNHLSGCKPIIKCIHYGIVEELGTAKDDIIELLMKSSTDVWYQGYNHRYVFLYNTTNQSNQFMCNYWDILNKRSIETWCEDGWNSVDDFYSQRNP